MLLPVLDRRWRRRSKIEEGITPSLNQLMSKSQSLTNSSLRLRVHTSLQVLKKLLKLLANQLIKVNSKSIKLESKKIESRTSGPLFQLLVTSFKSCFSFPKNQISTICNRELNNPSNYLFLHLGLSNNFLFTISLQGQNKNLLMFRTG